MTFDAGLSALPYQSGALDSQADKLLKRVHTTSASTPAAPSEDAKIKKAGSDFESILLGSWLQQAESSFATVPGGDGQDEGDSGKDQFQGIAMQALAGSLTKSGGIGISKMITEHLHSAADSQRARSTTTGGASTPAQSADLPQSPNVPAHG